MGLFFSFFFPADFDLLLSFVELFDTLDTAEDTLLALDEEAFFAEVGSDESTLEETSLALLPEVPLGGDVCTTAEDVCDLCRFRARDRRALCECLIGANVGRWVIGF